MSIRFFLKLYLETEETEHATSRCLYLEKLQKRKHTGSSFKFLEVVFDLLVPVVIARMIDVGIAGNNREVIIQNFFILLLMAAAGF